MGKTSRCDRQDAAIEFFEQIFIASNHWCFIKQLSSRILQNTHKDPRVHWVKIVRIWSFSGPHFLTFRLNTERYGVSLHIQSQCGKTWTRKTPNMNTFHAVVNDSHIFSIFWHQLFFITIPLPLDETHLDAVRWLIELRGLHPSASTSGDRRSDAATSDKDKQTCFILMPRTWFNMEEFRLE